MIRDDSVHEKVGEKHRCLEEDVWVACDSCGKCRKVTRGFDVDKDKSFFCYMFKDTMCDPRGGDRGEEEGRIVYMSDCRCVNEKRRQIYSGGLCSAAVLFCFSVVWGGMYVYTYISCCHLHVGF